MPMNVVILRQADNYNVCQKEFQHSDHVLRLFAFSSLAINTATFYLAPNNTLAKPVAHATCNQFGFVQPRL